jgi:hypothetical protein
MGCSERLKLGAMMVQQLIDDGAATTAGKGQVLHLPLKPPPAAHDSEYKLATSEKASTPNELVQSHERFQLQVRWDVESERELLYKSLLVVEILVFLFVLRELLLRWLA